MINQKKLTHLFKTFVNTVLLPIFKSNETVTSQWNYFSGMLSKDTIDLHMLEVYIDVLVKNGPQTFLTNINQPYKPPDDRIKTNSGFYNQRVQNNVDPLFIETNFHLNKTLGESDRAKITNMFPVKSLSPYGNQFSGNKDKLVQKSSLKGVSQAPSMLLGMEQIYKTLSQNQLRLEGNSLQMNNMGAPFYKFRQEKNP